MLCCISAYPKISGGIDNIKMQYFKVSKKKIHYLCEDWIVKSVLCDHHLSSHSKPCDAKQ